MKIVDIFELTNQEAILLQSLIKKTMMRIGDVNVVLGTHFRDRLLNRESDVSIQDILSMFVKMCNLHKDKLIEGCISGNKVIGILRDAQLNLNIPFELKKNRKDHKYYLTCITIKRCNSKEFKSNNGSDIDLVV